MNHISRRAFAALYLFSLTFSPAMAHALPLGDGQISNHAEQGFVYSCQTRFNPNAPGARASGNWLDDSSGVWNPDLKPFVDGSAMWPSEVTISLSGDQRIISANGLPDHATGVFPVRQTDDAFRYDRNPNRIRAQDILLRLDATPDVASRPSCVPMGMIGFTLSGAALFNALDARGDDAPAHEIQDACNGHPVRSGTYHYHNLSPCIADTQSGPAGHSDLMGYALDGFGIFGRHGGGGIALTTADLDACHGHVETIEWDGEMVEMYHYHFTSDYPYTIGCFAGTVSDR